MITIIISACLMSRNESCHAFRVPLPTEYNTFACNMSAQRYLPQWSEEHGDWQIAKWSCATVDVADLKFN